MARVYAHISGLLGTSFGHCHDVLELGCGATQYGHCFSGRHWGIDLDRMYCTESDLGPDAIANAEDLPFSDRTMDLVFAVATLLIVPDTGKVLHEALRVLRPGGTLLVFDYNPWVARRLARQDSSHRHQFSSRRLSRRFVEAGFSVQVHRHCFPLRGGMLGRALLSLPLFHRLAYAVSNWIVVSGTKPGT